jgi:hypothetical protein
MDAEHDQDDDDDQAGARDPATDANRALFLAPPPAA